MLFRSTALRQQLNDKLTGGEKDFIRHGGQDDWIPDPSKVPNKPPDPPVTVFPPDGGPPVKLKNYDEMKDFYENVMGVQWPYPPKVDKAAGAVSGAAHAADAAGDMTQTGKKAAQSAGDMTAPPPGMGMADDAATLPGRGPAGGAASNSNLNFTTPDGKKVSLNTGEKLGQGSTSSVFTNADNPTQAIRVTDIGGDVAQAPKLDKFGRQTVENLQNKLGKDSPIRIVEQHSQYTVNDPSSPLNNKVVEVVEKMDQGSAKKVLEAQGGKMTSGQAKAFDQASRALNDNGYAWLDNHSGNYTFEKVPGTQDDWRVVVIDPGGIVPMKGGDLTEKAANARAIQQMVNAPGDDLKSTLKIIENGEGQLKDMVLGEYRGEILNAYGQNIDIGAMGLNSVNEVGFNPGGLLKHDEVQSLFMMGPEQAAKFYGR